MRHLLLLLAWLPLSARAAPADDDKVRSRVERRVRLLRLVELSDALGLSDEKAIKLNKMMETFDERRRKIAEQTRDAKKIVKRSADGDEAAHKELDGAVERLLEARKAMNDVDRDMYRAVSKELTPAQRAKFVITMVEFRGRMEKMARQAKFRARDALEE